MSGISSAACEVTLTEDVFPEPNFRSPTTSIPYLPYGGGCYVEASKLPLLGKKQQILDRFVHKLMISALIYFFASLYLRVLLSEQEQEKIVDVDGSYTHRNYECLKELQLKSRC